MSARRQKQPLGSLQKCDLQPPHGPREGAIINELIVDDARALQLRFYCYLGLRGKALGGPEEQAEQGQFDSDNGYKAALLSTLKRTRELLADGGL